MKLTQYHHIVHAMFYKSVPLLTNHEELEMIRHEEQAVRKLNEEGGRERERERRERERVKGIVLFLDV